MACPNPHCNALLPSGAKACPRCQLPLPGVLFMGRYALERVLAAGEFLFAYQAVDTRCNRPVELRYLIAPTSAARDALLAEARAVERLAAPGVQGIVEQLEHEPPVLVLQGATGTPCLEKGHWSELELRALALQVAKQLDALHSRAIVHRDLRPEHLLIQEDGSVRLHGWGWEELLAERSGIKPKRGAEALDYLAPEAAEKAIPRSDLYALGMTLMHMATGKHPAELYDPLSRSYLWQDSHTLSNEFTLLIETLIQTKSSDRLPSSRVLVQKLEALMGTGEETAAPQAPQASRSRHPKENDRRLWLLLLLLLLLWPTKKLTDPDSGWTWRVTRLESVPPAESPARTPSLQQLLPRRMASASQPVKRAIALPSRKAAASPSAIPLGKPSLRKSLPARGGEGASFPLALKVGTRGEVAQSHPPAAKPRPPVLQPASSKARPAPAELRVSTSLHLLTLYRDNMVEMSFPVGLGASDSTPQGRFLVSNKAAFPDYLTPDGRLIPGRDPNNPLGTRWLGLAVQGRSGIGIHGTNEPDSIGDNRSQGCIRLRNEDMEKLYQAMPARAWVLIEP